MDYLFFYSGNAFEVFGLLANINLTKQMTPTITLTNNKQSKIVFLGKQPVSNHDWGSSEMKDATNIIPITPRIVQGPWADAGSIQSSKTKEATSRSRTKGKYLPESLVLISCHAGSSVA